jgi:hypothetical protein
MKGLFLSTLLLVASAFGQITVSGSGSPSGFALKPASASGVQFADGSSTGCGGSGCSDSNDGLSLGTAKKTVDAAVSALPNGSTSTTGNGTVFVASGTAWNATSTVGLWVMGSSDPNYSSPPTGWLKQGSGGLSIQCIGSQANPGNGHYPNCTVTGGSGTNTSQPGLWLSATNIDFRMVGINVGTYLAQPIKLGVCSDGTLVNCGSSNMKFEGLSDTINTVAASGPGVLIAGQSFWIYFDDCSLSGNSTAATGGATADAAAAVLMGGSTYTGNGIGLVHFRNCILNGGGIKYYAGTSGGNVFVDHLDTENSLEAAVWFATYTSPQFSEINHVEVSDCTGDCYGIRNDAAPASAIVAIDIGATILGPVDGFGGYGPLNTSAIPSTQGDIGVFGTHLIGQSDSSRRMFPPVAVREVNLATQASASWGTSGCASCTITGSITAPDGTTNAGQVSTTGSGQQQISFYRSLNTAISVGDEFLFGVWANSQTANGFNNGVPLQFALNSGGYGSGDTCSTGTAYITATTYAASGWAWYQGICKISAAPANAGLNFIGNLDSTHTPQYYAPIMIKFPSGTFPDNDTYDYLNQLSSYSASCSTGMICGLPGQVLHEDTFNVSLSTPGSSSATCSAGNIWADTGFVYVCTSANTIKRAALSSF